ncbi:MAG: hypothetical protein RR942_06465 [Romboutsia sp.]
MRKFKVVVERIEEYEIEIDDNVINDEFMDEYERYMCKLKEHKDRLSSLAGMVGMNRATEYGYEGIGYPLVHGEKENYSHQDTNEYINISDVDEGYMDIRVKEIS